MCGQPILYPVLQLLQWEQLIPAKFAFILKSHPGPLSPGLVEMIAQSTEGYSGLNSLKTTQQPPENASGHVENPPLPGAASFAPSPWHM